MNYLYCVVHVFMFSIHDFLHGHKPLSYVLSRIPNSWTLAYSCMRKDTCLSGLVENFCTQDNFTYIALGFLTAQKHRNKNRILRGNTYSKRKPCLLKDRELNYYFLQVKWSNFVFIIHHTTFSVRILDLFPVLAVQCSKLYNFFKLKTFPQLIGGFFFFAQLWIMQLQ